MIKYSKTPLLGIKSNVIMAQEKSSASKTPSSCFVGLKVSTAYIISFSVNTQVKNSYQLN